MLKIKKIHISRFRLFHDIDIHLGNYLTILAGTNAVGKSTLLGMLGNTAELKMVKGLPLLQKRFRTEFGEIFKASQEYDKSGSKLFRVEFNDGDHRDCRVAWPKKQDGNGKRFRIISDGKDSNGKTFSRKKDWPTLYLGLSRLYPVGESIESGITKEDMNPEYKEWLLEKYKYILSMSNSNISSINTIGLEETDRKKGFGVNTDKYTYLTNSAGQDNLGQILCTILSFKLLKEKEGTRYNGGMLLIDEIDATMHPAAQNRLISFLIEQSKALNLQIVCTTHSLSLIKYIFPKYMNNDNGNNNIEMFYLTNANDRLEVLRNPNYELIENNLLVTTSPQSNSKIKIYAEDNEARWFIRKILENMSSVYSNVEIINSIKLGEMALLSLVEGDPLYFNNIIIVLDGDGRLDLEVKKKVAQLRNANIVFLPGDCRPEKVFKDFLSDPESEHADRYFQNPVCFECGLTKTQIREENLEKYRGDEREKYKQWFNELLATFETTNLFEYWLEGNKGNADNFICAIKNSYNTIARRKFIPIIR